MSFQRPTLSQLVDRIQSDFVSRLTLVGALLRKAVVFVLSRVMAGAAHMLHGHLAYLAAQLFPDTSDDPFLIRQASVFGLTKDPATFARYTIALTGTNGQTAPATSTLVNSIGLEYTTDADATIASGVASVNVTATLAGSDSILPVGAVLSFESPVAGVSAAATVSAVVEDGSDEEDTEGLRTRLKARMAEPSHGGDLNDYVEWCKAGSTAHPLTGVTRVWPIKLGLGPGTVLVYFVRDNDGSGAAIIPDTGEVAAVQVVLDELAPAHATATAAAPTDTPLAVTCHLNPDTSATRAAVTASLNDFFFRTSSPEGITTLLSGVETAIGDAMRESVGDSGDYSVSVPSADTTHTVGQLARLGTLTFT